MINIKRGRLGKPLLLALVLGFAAFGLFGWGLSSLTPGLSPAEAAARVSSSSLGAIAGSPINAPHKLTQLLFGHIPLPDSIALRLASVGAALIFTACFYLLVRHWFGKTVGIFGTLLFISTPLVIVMARQGSPEIMYLSPLAAAGAYYWLIRTKRHLNAAWLTLFVVSGLALYTPGVIWWLILGAIAARVVLTNGARRVGRGIFLGSFAILAIILAPLVAAVAKEPLVLKSLLLVPSKWPQIPEALESIGGMAVGLVWQAPYHHPLIINKLPLLAMAQVALAIFGAYAMFAKAKNKVYILMSVLLLGVIAAGLNQNLAILAFVLPVVSLLAAAGLRFLYLEWKVIFPKNPLAHMLAIFLMLSLIGAHLFFGVRYGLVAWPRSMETRQLYVLQ
ncbi:MAG: glycosyltransferase family 39 protein [Candidatus Saccharimonadales bacterium]